MKKNRYILFSTFILMSSYVFCYAERYLEKSNEFIKVLYNIENHRFWFCTTGGNPGIDSDDNKKLLYHSGSIIDTSYTTIKIDGENYIYGYDLPTNLETNINDSDSISSRCVWENKVEVGQRVSISFGLTSSNYDTMKIEYDIKNVDSRPHTVGLRILLDTYLGDNDGAPFSVPGLGSVTTDTSLKSGQIPDYWYVFDNLSNPTVSAVTALHLSGYIEPDEVVFSHWGHLYSSKWDINLKHGRKFKVFLGGLDSACAVYWNPIIFGPGEEKKYAITYGVYKATVKFGDVINVAVGCPERVRENMPFTVSCDVENKSDEYPVDEVEVNLILPPGVTLSDPRDSLSRTITGINPKEIAKASWILRLKGVSLEKAKFSVKVTGRVKNRDYAALRKNSDKFSVGVQSNTVSIEPQNSIIGNTIKDFLQNLEKAEIKVSTAVGKSFVEIPPVKSAIQPETEIKKIFIDKEVFIIPPVNLAKLVETNNNISGLTKNIKKINSDVNEINAKLDKINRNQK